MGRQIAELDQQLRDLAPQLEQLGSIPGVATSPRELAVCFTHPLPVL